MKKIIVIAAVLLLLGIQAKAQLVTGAGYIYSSEKYAKVDEKTPYHGGFVGVSYNIPVVAGLGVAPGVYASLLIHKEAANAGSAKTNYNIAGSRREVAVNIPVHVTYSLKLGSNIGLFAYAGPMFQVGLINTTTVTGSVSILGFNYSDGAQVNNYDSDKGTVNRFNIFLGGGAGVQLGDILFHVGYDHSLMDFDKTGSVATSRGLLKVGIGIGF